MDQFEGHAVVGIRKEMIEMAHDKYVAPVFGQKAFTCPLCDVYSNFSWKHLYLHLDPPCYSGVLFFFCSHCEKPTIWIEEGKRMIRTQDISAAPLTNSDMPEDIQKNYTEARSITASSPRKAAALLGLSIQKLCSILARPARISTVTVGTWSRKAFPSRFSSLSILSA